MAQYGIDQRYRGSGVTMPGIAGETVPRGAAVYMSAVDGLWYLADSDAVATLPAVGIVSDAGTAGNIIQIIILGIIERSDWTWTRGDPIYVSGTAGVLTQTAGTIRQQIGVAITATIVLLNPAPMSTVDQMFEYRNLDWDTATDVPVDPIVINTWYTALVPTDDVKAYYLVVEQTNNGAAVEDIEVELTIDGTPVVGTIAGAVSGSQYYMRFVIDGTMASTVTTPRQVLALDNDQSAPLETRSLQIRVRQTTAVDLVSAIIEVNMVYDTLEVT